MQMVTWIEEKVRAVGASAARVPVEVAICASAALTMILIVERTWLVDDEVELLLTFLVAFPLAWTGTLLAAWGRIGRLAAAAVGVAAVLASAAIFFFGFDLSLKGHGTSALLLVVTAMGVPLLAPLALRNPEARDRRGWRFHVSLVQRVAAVAGVVFLWWIGLMLALRAVDVLFDLRFSGKIFAHASSVLWLGMAPWLAAAGVDIMTREEVQEDEEPKWPTRVLSWVLIPLQLVYLGILLAYVVRIVLLWEFPSNIVSPMWIGAAILCFLGLLLERPNADALLGPFALRMQRWLPPVLALLAPLAVAGVLLRTGQYGITEWRWVRLLLVGALVGVLVVSSVPRWTFRVPRRLTALLLMVATTAALTWGPLSASSRSFASQTSRLEAMLREVAYVPGEPISSERIEDAVERVGEPGSPFPAHIHSRSLGYFSGHDHILATGQNPDADRLVEMMRSQVHWISDHHGMGPLYRITGFSENDCETAYQCLELLGLDYGQSPTRPREKMLEIEVGGSGGLSPALLASNSTAASVVRVELREGNESVSLPGGGEVFIEDGRIKLVEATGTYEVDVASLLLARWTATEDSGYDASQAERWIHVAATDAAFETDRVLLLPQRLTGLLGAEPEAAWRLVAWNGWMIIRAAEAP